MWELAIKHVVLQKDWSVKSTHSALANFPLVAVMNLVLVQAWDLAIAIRSVAGTRPSSSPVCELVVDEELKIGGQEHESGVQHSLVLFVTALAKGNCVVGRVYVEVDQVLVVPVFDLESVIHVNDAGDRHR